MSTKTIDLVVTRNFGGHKRGDVLTVSADDARMASHVLAGNATALDPDALETLAEPEANDVLDNDDYWTDEDPTD